MMRIFYNLIMWLGIFLPSIGYADGIKINVKSRLVSSELKPVLLMYDSIYVFECGVPGEASLQLDHLKRGEYGRLKIGKASIPLYIEPGQFFCLDVDEKGIVTGISGKGALKNNYLQRTVSRGNPNFKQDDHTFIKNLEKLEEQLYQELDSLNFDQEFTALEKLRLRYGIFSVLRVYPYYHAMVLHAKVSSPSSFFYDYIEKLLIEDESKLRLDEYKMGIAELVAAYCVRNFDDIDILSNTKSCLEYVDKNIKSAVLAELLTHTYIFSYVNRSGLTGLSEIMPFYKAKVNSPKLKALLNDLCSSKQRVETGQPSPSFRFQNITGHMVTLEEFRGKYVYIDIWATWCGPCKEELPALQELGQYFKDKNIAFVSISNDRDKNAWQKFVREQQPGGTQLYGGENNAFSQFYNVSGIPRFILLDKEGKIVNINMSRPSNPSTKQFLDGLKGI